MKAIPILRCPDLRKAIAFYTTILDFKLKYPEEANDLWVVNMVNGDAELLLSSIDGTAHNAVLMHVDDVDAIFDAYIRRGLVVPNNPDSPVHNGPIDQTWGLREFYVDDPFGNTLRFAAPIV